MCQLGGHKRFVFLFQNLIFARYVFGPNPDTLSPGPKRPRCRLGVERCVCVWFVLYAVW